MLQGGHVGGEWPLLHRRLFLLDSEGIYAWLVGLLLISWLFQEVREWRRHEPARQMPLGSALLVSLKRRLRIESVIDRIVARRQEGTAYIHVEACDLMLMCISIS